MSRKPKQAATKTFRCAIYTRKSCEEGLDLDFNSLDAQRESAEAYIASQVFASHSWSPDGSQLVIGDSGTSGNPGAMLSVWDVATGNSQFLLHAIDDFAGHSWAPDGSRILVHDGSDILLVNPDGTGLTTLLDGGRSAYYSHAFWSPDSKWIVYRKLTSTRSIYKFPVAGGKEVNLAKDLNGVQQWPLGWTAN